MSFMVMKLSSHPMKLYSSLLAMLAKLMKLRGLSTDFSKFQHQMIYWFPGTFSSGFRTGNWWIRNPRAAWRGTEAGGQGQKDLDFGAGNFSPFTKRNSSADHVACTTKYSRRLVSFRLNKKREILVVRTKKIRVEKGDDVCLARCPWHRGRR